MLHIVNVFAPVQQASTTLISKLRHLCTSNRLLQKVDAKHGLWTGLHGVDYRLDLRLKFELNWTVDKSIAI